MKILVLLLLAASFSARAQDQPDATKSDSALRNATVVAIPTDDEYYIGKEVVARADVSQHLRQILKGKEEPVYIKAACGVKYGTVVLLIDELRQAGFQVGLVANKKKAAGRSSPKTSTPANNASIPTNIRSSEPATGAVSIEVRSKTVVVLNGVSMPASVLQNRLSRLIKDRSDTSVIIIEAPTETDYCDIVNVIDRAKAAGATQIALHIANRN